MRIDGGVLETDSTRKASGNQPRMHANQHESTRIKSKARTEKKERLFSVLILFALIRAHSLLIFDFPYLDNFFSLYIAASAFLTTSCSVCPDLHWVRPIEPVTATLTSLPPAFSR